jgi:hypothetical protein
MKGENIAEETIPAVVMLSFLYFLKVSDCLCISLYMSIAVNPSVAPKNPTLDKPGEPVFSERKNSSMVNTCMPNKYAPTRAAFLISLIEWPCIEPGFCAGAADSGSLGNKFPLDMFSSLEFFSVTDIIFSYSYKLVKNFNFKMNYTK